MPQFPIGVAFSVQSKTTNQTKWQVEDEFVVTDLVPEGEAQAQALAAFDALVAAHTGGGREYRCLKCVELAFETRPV